MVITCFRYSHTFKIARKYYKVPLHSSLPYHQLAIFFQIVTQNVAFSALFSINMHKYIHFLYVFHLFIYFSPICHKTTVKMKVKVKVVVVLGKFGPNFIILCNNYVTLTSITSIKQLMCTTFQTTHYVLV